MNCVFCGKPYKSKKLLEGVNGSVCENCFKAIKIMNNPFESKDEPLELKREHIVNIEELRPNEIKSILDDYIIGQDEAKKLLVTEVYLHLKYAKNKALQRKKNNICLIGPSGCGKTYMIEKLAELLNVPFVIQDASVLSSTGYVGSSVSNIFERLYEKSGKDIAQAQRGIVFIDEIDKLSPKYSSTPNGSDVGTIPVQQELLKALEGSVYELGGTNPVFGLSRDSDIYFDTKNVLFILGGAFVGLDDIRTTKTNRVGFQIDESIKEDKKTAISSDDLIKYGLIPELVGRVSLLMELNALTIDELEEVLINSKESVVKSYKEVFSKEGIELEFTNDCLHKLAESVHKGKIGVRGLNNHLAKLLTDKLFTRLENSDFTNLLIENV